MRGFFLGEAKSRQMTWHNWFKVSVMKLMLLYHLLRKHLREKMRGCDTTFTQRIEALMLPAPRTEHRYGNVILQSGEAELDALWSPPPNDDGHVVLLSHGNGEILKNCFWWLEEFKKHGYGVLVYDYAGYGGSTERNVAVSRESGLLCRDF